MSENFCFIQITKTNYSIGNKRGEDFVVLVVVVVLIFVVKQTIAGICPVHLRK